jgi:2-methylcitrate dehydratase PrpD
METNMEPTQTLAEYIAGASYDHLPKRVRGYAKVCLLDSLGCMIGGIMTPFGGIVLDLMSGLGGKPEATVWATGRKVPALHAAYANAYLANALDFDDTDMGHPGACVIPAALAVAEQRGASGQELISAIVVGYEVYSRVAQAIQATPERNRLMGGVSSTQLIGIFGATAAACTLLHLPAKAVAMALGLAGEQAPIPASLMGYVAERPMSWSKNNCGWVAMGGVLAAQLAEKGFQASRKVFDRESRFWLRAGSDQCRFEHFTQGLGQEYRILNISVKPYPCCRYTHTVLDATKAIMEEHELKAASVERVEIRSFSRLAKFLDYKPQSIIDAQFSLPYVLAMVLLDKSPGYEWLSPANLEDKKVLQNAGKVIFAVDEEAERIYFDLKKRQYPATVILGCTDGTQWDQTAFIPRGDPQNAMSYEEIRAKFETLTDPVISPKKSEGLLQSIEQLENLRVASNIAEALQ